MKRYLLIVSTLFPLAIMSALAADSFPQVSGSGQQMTGSPDITAKKGGQVDKAGKDAADKPKAKHDLRHVDWDKVKKGQKPDAKKSSRSDADADKDNGENGQEKNGKDFKEKEDDGLLNRFFDAPKLG